VPVRPPQTSRRLKVVGLLALLLALASGWYVVSLGWGLLFLLADGWLMAIYSLILLLSPALFTVVAIFAVQGKRRPASWLLTPLYLKWVVAYVYSFLEGGWQLVWLNLPVINAITRLGDESVAQYSIDQLVMLIAQFDAELVVLAVMAVLVARKPRR